MVNGTTPSCQEHRSTEQVIFAHFLSAKRMVRTHLIYPVPTEEPAVAGIGWTITTTYMVAQSPSLGTWETLSMMLRRAELRSGKHLLKSSDASRGSQRGHSSRRAGKPFHMAKGHSLRGGCVVIPSDDKAWESLPRPTEHSGPKKNPLRRRPYAVKAARTVTTGGMERRVEGYRALSLPTNV
jgi:hypothetical protein